ncbi:acyltransferase [Sphingomonas koreensis]|nr:acyltransferase [Sphingomonas koreensis]
MTARPELRALTSVRGIAAWFVVLYHIRLSMAFAPASLVAIFAKGYLAVDFFFLLSGFVIWLSWGERLRRDGLVAAPDFLKRRIARVWPLHLFMLGVAVALALLLIATGRPADQFPWATLPLNILLLQDWGFTRGLAWNVPAWSISVELGAYLIFPLLTLAIDWRRTPTPVILAVLAGLFALLHAAMHWAGAATLGTAIDRLGLLRCLIEFSAGTALCALWLRWAATPLRFAVAAGALAAALLGGWASGRLPETLAVAPGFAAALIALALTSGMRWNPLDGRALHYLGEISYATYLSHFLLFVLFKLAIVDDPRDVPAAQIALFLLIVLAASIALYHVVERPAQRWINGWRAPPKKTLAVIDR